MKSNLGRSRFASIFIFVSFACFAVNIFAQDYTRWVNPFIGTGEHGHTFPGATMPFGMVQLSPDTRTDNWDGSSGYHYSDDVIYGFSHTHLNGTGIPDGCDILFMPTLGRAMFANNANGYPAAKFSHATEHAEPGYYSVRFDVGIFAELTATQRVGLHKYTFPKGADPNIVLDLRWRDKLIDRSLNIVGNNRIEGFRRSSSWAKDQIVYFVAEFSDPFSSNEVDMEADRGANSDQKGAKYNFHFNNLRTNQILVKVAISNVSIEGARKNLEAELPGWDFDKVRSDAKAAWNKELSKIEVSGGTDAQMMTFYTALYHTMIQPNVFNDVDGQYRGIDGKIHSLEPERPKLIAQTPKPGQKTDLGIMANDLRSHEPVGTQYSVFSLWDTFRAAHPLYTIIDEKRTADFINTFIRQYEQGGRLPVWELWGNETDCMIGYHAVSVIADAMKKGIKGFDYEKAYNAAKHSAELDHYGLAAYKKRGYISSEDENESVSKTLEYAYDDWCIAQMAGKLSIKLENEIMSTGIETGTKETAIRHYLEDYNHYLKRARSFENLYDAKTGFMRAKKNGGFISPFVPSEVNFNFTEGNSWVYSFFVPQDISRLIELQGGKEKFAAKLDELFNTSDKLTGREQPDITGLIGQYAHGNEPSHHLAYLYDYVGQPWKTQRLIRKIMDEFYKPEPDGLIGNEDCGQMSAWYILSASGFYEVTPGSGTYVFGTPLFKEVKYHLENGKTFTIKAPNVSPTNLYIGGVKLNGRAYKKNYFAHTDITSGGTLEFQMTDKEGRDAFTDFPVSEIRSDFVATPQMIADASFSTDETVTIKPAGASDPIFYTTDGSGPTAKSTEYTGPFKIDKTTTVRAIAIRSVKLASPIVDSHFIKKNNNWSVKLNSQYGEQYTGGGDEGVIDGIRGGTSFSSGEWQGYQGTVFDAVIDLKKDTQIKEAGAGFLQNTTAWIWMPSHVIFEVSADGKEFRQIADIKSDVDQRNEGPVIRDLSAQFQPVNARYIRVRAYNIGKIPAWHPGSGGDPWIFVDEVWVK